MNFRVSLSLVCFGVLLPAVGVHSQAQGQYEGNCTTSGCHGDYSKRKVVHNPVTQGACDACHEAKPGEGHKFRLIREGAALCTECHDEVTKDLPFVHGPVAVGACTACHQPHASDHAHLLLTSESPGLCLDCHDQIASLLSANPHHHGPVSKGECGPCHDPHGATNARLLVQDYPPKFYAPFTEKQYALCFECHEAEAFTEKQTEDATGFRDGTRNLHYLHVNQPVKGRTCRACHDPHAGKNAKLVVESVPFGSWNIPLNFKETATGGTCLPGCHRPATYDRTKPVKEQP